MLTKIGRWRVDANKIKEHFIELLNKSIYIFFMYIVIEGVALSDSGFELDMSPFLF
jgi:hypothetical protein